MGHFMADDWETRMAPQGASPSGTVGAVVRRVEPCKARCGAYKTRTWRKRHFWGGTDRCVWCGKTKAEVGAVPNADSARKDFGNSGGGE